MSRNKRRRAKDPDYDHFEDDDADPIQVLADELMEHPRVRDVFDQFSSMFDQFGYAIDRAARRTVATDPQKERQYAEARRRMRHYYARAKRAEANARAANPPSNPPRPSENPRKILGFGPNEPLTAEMVKRRQRDFAAIVHPDKGGSTEAMQRYNAAATALLAQLKY